MTVQQAPFSKPVLTLYAIKGGSHLHALVSLDHNDYRVHDEELGGVALAMKDLVYKRNLSVGSDTLQFLISPSGAFQTFITSTRQSDLDAKVFTQRIVRHIISQAKAHGWLGEESGNQVLIDKLFSKEESELMVSNM